MKRDRLMRPIAAKKRACAHAPGACGELVQGQFRSGDDFLVTLPVDLWTEVRVELHPASSVVLGNPRGKEKTRLAVRRALDYLGFSHSGAEFTVKSDIPEGKGLASSTADIVAACQAVSRATGRRLSPEEISQIAIGIEPSDGVMYPDVVCYNHRRGRLVEALGTLPPADILAIDRGGHVDTVQFNGIPKRYTEEELEMLQHAYELVKAGVRECSLESIGAAATLSARINQRLLPNPHLEFLIEIAEAYGAHGICAAHSGTIAGLLFDRGAAAVESARDAIWQKTGSTLVVYTLHS